MTFGELLNQYIEEIGCSAKELADASGLSAAVISRYRTGTRVPAAESDSLYRLAEGIAQLSGHADPYSTDSIMKKFTDLLRDPDFDFDLLAENLSLLISAIDLNINRLARSMNYDASYISRIRNGQRRPADPNAFADSVCRFVSNGCTALEERAAIAALIGKPVSMLDDQHTCFSLLRQWLCSGKSEKSDSLDHFLNKLDTFSLNDYIRSIRFDDLKVPTVPFQFSTSKDYIGLEQMRTGELDFFKATVLSRSSEPVFMCSDMDMADMAADADFSKKWMFAIAMCLKKGLHLNMIHTIDRPFDEMMLGLESWIPIYMTGQVSPYYLNNARSNVYQHLNYVSGAAALVGECIAGHHKDGKYYLTKKAGEVAYYRKKSEFMLKKALPLMEIYRSERSDRYQRFVSEDAVTSGNRHSILSAPPIYTIPDDLLENILSVNGISNDERGAIRSYVQASRQTVETILHENTLLDELHRLSAEEFTQCPVFLSLEGMFFEKDIPYTYETYLRHLEATSAYAQNHKNYSIRLIIHRAFRRIQFFIHEGKFAIISKGDSPTVHFAIRQPRLREAIENMILPIVE